MPKRYLLAIDQGTTNSRAHIFTTSGELIATHQQSLSSTYPEKGWVEQNPEEIWANTLSCCREVLSQGSLSSNEIAGIGITNQRETTIIWDKETGKPIYPAISWQDRRTADMCVALSQNKISSQLQEKTGLLLDPYFSATKIMWLLHHIKGARKRAERGELLFGTIDTFLLWRLTKGKVHTTDATNASRTMLFNIQSQLWDQDILTAFNIPSVILPKVFDSSADFGKIDIEFLGHDIPVTSMIGDQQAALVGQACFTSGMVKSTYGTGCFVVLNTGKNFVKSTHRLLSTIAYRINGEVTYALEGSIFSAGTTIKWLRDHLKVIQSAAESESLAEKITTTSGVYFVPAFTGLGAPFWDPYARASISGLTFDSSIEEIVRAALEAIAYQTRDLIDAMVSDHSFNLSTIRVDGGMTVNNWLLQFLADILNLNISRPACTESTALGAAFLAGLQLGIYQSLEEISKLRQNSKEFSPKMDDNTRTELYNGWKDAVRRIVRD